MEVRRRAEYGESQDLVSLSWTSEKNGLTVPLQEPLVQTCPGCERAPLVEITPIPALQQLLRRHGEVRHPSWLWRRWVLTKAGGRGQLPRPTAPLHPKLPLTCCHRPALHHYHQTKPDHSHWQRDAGQDGKKWWESKVKGESKGWEKPLCVARSRHAGSEPAWARSQLGTEILCPFFLKGPSDKEALFRGRKRCPPRPSHFLFMHFRRMEPEGTADDRPAPPGTICPASSIREK